MRGGCGMRFLGCEGGVAERCGGGGIGLPGRCGGDKRPLRVGESVRGWQDLRGILEWKGEGGQVVIDRCPARLPIVISPVSGVESSDS